MMKQSALTLAILFLTCALVRSASIADESIVEDSEATQNRDSIDNEESTEDMEESTEDVEGEIFIENAKDEAPEQAAALEWMLNDHHRQKRRSGLRNTLCNWSCGDRGGYCRYSPGYYGSISCRNNHVCVCN